MLGQPDELKHNNPAYALSDDSELRGGYRPVASVAERNAIPADKRKVGMEVLCLDTKVRYRLEGGVADGDWVECTVQGEDGASAYELAVSSGFVGTQAEWIASLKGENGATAYEVAIANGFVGTEAEWLESLNATDGDDGATAYELAVASGFVGSQAEWIASLQGEDGATAYEVAIANGFVGTEAEWLESLNATDGDDGATAYELAVASGFVGTQAEWIASLQGEDGATAYEVAVANGFVGTEAEWLESLNATDGDDGATAYELAVASGFVGSQAEWIASLKGEDGATAYEVAVSNGFVGTEAEWLESTKGEDGARYGVSYQSLGSATAQTIDASVSNEALCNVQLLGDTTIMLSNLTVAAFGVIDVVEQVEQRVITIIAEDDNQAPIVVKTISGSQIATVIGASLSIAWKFNGSWVDINAMEYA